MPDSDSDSVSEYIQVNSCWQRPSLPPLPEGLDPPNPPRGRPTMPKTITATQHITSADSSPEPVSTPMASGDHDTSQTNQTNTVPTDSGALPGPPEPPTDSSSRHLFQTASVTECEVFQSHGENPLAIGVSIFIREIPKGPTRKEQFELQRMTNLRARNAAREVKLAEQKNAYANVGGTEGVFKKSWAFRSRDGFW